MMRYLRLNHRTSVPCNIMSAFIQVKHRGLECEPGHNIYQFAAAGIVRCRLTAKGATRKQEYYCDTLDEFWSTVRTGLDKQRPLWLWTYRAGIDMTVCELWQRMLDEEYTLAEPMERFRARKKQNKRAVRQHGMLVTTDPPVIGVFYHYTGCRLIWVDLRNWAEEPFGGASHENQKDAGNRAVAKVVQLPCRYVCQQGSRAGLDMVSAITRLVRENDFGNFRFTCAGQSMAAFRHRFMCQRILTHENPRVRRLERDGYFTGQVEAFYVGPVGTCVDSTMEVKDYAPGEQRCEWSRDIYHLDINGLYPFCMQECRFPTALVAYQRGVPVSELGKTAEGFCHMARVQIRSQDQEYPVKHNGQTMYCTGLFDTILCGPELSHALSCGHVSRVYEVATYALGRPFREYVQSIWALRNRYKSAGNDTLAGLCKLLLVSLHGKFAQRRAQWMDVPGAVSDEAWGPFYATEHGKAGVTEFRAVAYNVQRCRDRLEKPGTFIAVSAFTTAYGREYMRNLRGKCPPKSIYYQGTDSLICSSSAYEALCNSNCVAPDQLGFLRIKGMHTSACIHNINDYALDGARAKSGVVSPDSAGPSGGWIQTETAKLDTSLSIPTGPVAYSYRRMLEDRSTYVRGKIGEDGWRKPWNLG